jgi:hypothetical protein
MPLLLIGDELVRLRTLCGRREVYALLSGTVTEPWSGWSVPFLRPEKTEDGVVRYHTDNAG